VLPGDAPAAGRRGEGAGRRRDGASAPPGGALDAASTPGKVPAPEVAARAAVSVPAGAGPTQEQRQRFLDQVKDDPTALERRKAFLAQIDSGDPAALERWQRIIERRSQGAQAPTQ